MTCETRNIGVNLPQVTTGHGQKKNQKKKKKKIQIKLPAGNFFFQVQIQMAKPLKFWSLTIGCNYHTLLPPDKVDAIFDEFYSQWCYQGERGSCLGKDHYQCRIISGEPVMKATLLHCLEMRGMDKRDVTFLPESNKSIEQGGLAFYVMDSTKDVFLPMRADSLWTPHRGKDWVPNMCKCIVDEPRPWMTSVLELLAAPPHHRSIIWICTLDGKGGVGKSLFNCYLEATGKACFLGSGTPTQILEAVCAEGEHRAYTLDLPKTQDSNIKIGDYINVLETVKNGFIKTAMHGKRKKLIMEDRPHEIVFSNIMPPFKAMTEGRFIVYTINPDLGPEFQTLDHVYNLPGSAPSQD